MKLVSASTTSVIIYMSIPMSLILDLIVFGASFNVLEIVGGVIILATNISFGYMKAKGIIK